MAGAYACAHRLSGWLFCPFGYFPALGAYAPSSRLGVLALYSVPALGHVFVLHIILLRMLVLLLGPQGPGPIRASGPLVLHPISAICLERTVVASKCANEVAGAGSVKSSAGT